MNWKCHITHTGYCTSNRSEVLQGKKRETIRFYATIGILEHEKHGLILFDIGYHNKFFESTRQLPFSLYANITPVFHSAHQTAANRLRSLGYEPEQVKLIIISHFHADHIAGAVDFPNARFICSQEAWDSVKSLRGFSALRRGFIPSLLPVDFKNRLQILVFDDSKHIKVNTILGPEYDLFNDGSLLLCQLPGHAAGQIGMRLQTEDGEMFFIADAAWVKENYQKMHLPSPIVKLFFSSWIDFKASLKKVNAYYNSQPKTQIIPCHCMETLLEINPDSIEI
jgi:glyoxylase-like metal-dependent hydrolase (beta-lactamase superfamily II)